MRVTNLVDSDKLLDHEVVVYSDLESHLVVAIQRNGIVAIRITLTSRGTPHIMVIDPGPRR